MTVVTMNRRAPSDEDAAAIKIESGIPMPATSQGRRHNKYPFGDMDVGHSFVWPRKPDEFNNVLNYASNYASVAGRKLNRKFTTAYREEGGEKIIRVWRTA
jgi:hypothetical protein